MSTRDPALASSDDLFAAVGSLVAGHRCDDVINALCSALAVALLQSFDDQDEAVAAALRLSVSIGEEIRENWENDRACVKAQRSKRGRLS